MTPRTSSNRIDWARIALGLLPFAILVAAYLYGSHVRHIENPQDKLLPGFGQMAEAVKSLAFEEDARTGKVLFWTDTWNSLRRLALGVGIAALAGLLIGLNMGLARRLRDLFGPFLTFWSMVPPLAILPILFIVLGIEELSKVSLIFLGVFPVIARDILLATEMIPREQIVKAQTLGASHMGIVYRVVMPQLIPRLIDAIRLSLGSAWLFLIAAEAIASTEGLGYRIFLMRRYLSMDVILPYVAWITLLGFTFDVLLKQLIARRYRWYLAAKG